MFFLPFLTSNLISFFFFNFLKIVFVVVFFWLHCVFVAVRGLSLVVESRGYSLVAVGGLLRGFFCCGAQAGSRARGLQ